VLSGLCGASAAWSFWHGDPDEKYAEAQMCNCEERCRLKEGSTAKRLELELETLRKQNEIMRAEIFELRKLESQFESNRKELLACRPKYEARCEEKLTNQESFLVDECKEKLSTAGAARGKLYRDLKACKHIEKRIAREDRIKVNKQIIYLNSSFQEEKRRLVTRCNNELARRASPEELLKPPPKAVLEIPPLPTKSESSLAIIDGDSVDSNSTSACAPCDLKTCKALQKRAKKKSCWDWDISRRTCCMLANHTSPDCWDDRYTAERCCGSTCPNPVLHAVRPSSPHGLALSAANMTECWLAATRIRNDQFYIAHIPSCVAAGSVGAACPDDLVCAEDDGGTIGTVESQAELVMQSVGRGHSLCQEPRVYKTSLYSESILDGMDVSQFWTHRVKH
jgi:hypothetical protein